MSVYCGAIAAIIAILVPASAAAWLRSTSDHGAKLKWPNSDIYWTIADKRIPHTLVEAAAATWMQPGCSRLQLRRATAGQVATLVVKVAEEPWPHAADEAAWTSVVADADSGAIRQATIALHPRYWLDPAATLNRQALLVHEWGHALGLAHTIDRGTVMYGGLGTQVTLSADEVSAMCALFARRPLPEPAPLFPLVAGLAAVVLAVAVGLVGRSRRLS
ncbi:MAG: matrixin family metalloprotease [Myxococcales bacterium]|nr:matrixin family metalloprotease [Myxococcales bacterium]